MKGISQSPGALRHAQGLAEYTAQRTPELSTAPQITEITHQTRQAMTGSPRSLQHILRGERRHNGSKHSL